MKKYIYSALAFVSALFATSCSNDIEAPFSTPEKPQPGSKTIDITLTHDGTQADPFTVADALQYGKQLSAGETSTQSYYIKGVVSSVSECSASYGNAAFYLVDPTDTASTKSTFYAYRVYGLNNDKIKTGTDVVAGDTVTICTPIYNYSGTIETPTNKGYIVANGRPIKGDGTEANPYDALSVQAVAWKLASGQSTTEKVWFKGFVTEVKEVSKTNNNATFYIGEENDAENSFYCYRALGLDGKIADSHAVMVGDEVTMCGNLTNYNGTYESVAKDCQIMKQTMVERPVVVYDIDFTQSQEGWTVKDVTKPSGVSSSIWTVSTTYGYKANATKKAASESWLISPAIDFSKSKTGTMTISHAGKYWGTASEEGTCWYSLDGGSTWTQAAISAYPSSWTYVDGIVDLSACAGKSNVKVAFKYISTTAAYATWEIKTVTIE